jgi:hypothetical protein
MRDDRRVADADRQQSDVIRTLGQVVGLGAGIIALVYAAGGGVLALRLYLGDLPSRTVVGQLPRDLLISVGLAQIVLPGLAVAGLYAIGRLLLGPTPAPKTFVDQWKQRSRRTWAVLVGVSAIPALLTTAAMTLGVELGVERRPVERKLLWLLPVTFLLTLLIALVCLNLRARLADRYGDSASSWNMGGPIVRMSLVAALAFLPGCVVFAGTIHLLEVKVCTTLGPPMGLSAPRGRSLQGVFIGETSDRTYIGQRKRPGRPLLVFSVPQSRITETFIGGNAHSRPCPTPGSTQG